MPDLLTLMILAFPFFIAVLVPICASYFCWRCSHDPVMGVKLALWLFLVNSFFPLPVLPIGINIFAPDLLYLMFAMIGFFRVFQIKDYQISHWLWLLLGSVLLGLFVVGTFKFKTAAGVEFRQFFAFWAGAMYLMTFQLNRKQVDDIFRAWVLIAAVMIPLVCFRWLAMGLGLSWVSEWNEGGASLRVVSASQTLFLAQSFIVAYYLWLRNLGSKWWAWMLPIMFCCVLVLQHRSVWVVTLVSLALIYVLMPENRKKIKKQFLVGAMVSAVLLGPLMATGKLDVISNSLEHSVEEAGSEKSTFMWRLQSAFELLNGWAHDGPVVLLVGKPFGSGYERYVKAQNDAKVNVNPHNYYVLTILRGGSIGLLAIFLVYIIAIRKFMVGGLSSGDMIEGRLLAILLIGQMLFYMTYQAPEIQFVLIGLALTLGVSISKSKVGIVSYPLKSVRRSV